MDAARTALILLISACLTDAATYPPLVKSWEITLGGDTLDVRDVNGDGTPEIVLGIFREQGSYAYLLDNNGTLIWRNKISVIWPQNTPRTLKVDDLENNNKTDIIVGSVIEAQKTCSVGFTEFSHPIFVLERDPALQNNELKWSHRGYGYPISMDVSDIDGDNLKEIVSGSRDGSVYAIKSDGNMKWKYSTEGTVNSILITDLNQDKVPEILAGSYNYTHLINNLGHTLWRYKTGAQVMALYAADINKDSLKEVLAVGDNSMLYTLSTDGDLLWNYTLTALKPTVTATDMDDDTYPEIIIAEAQTVRALDWKGKEEWEYDVGYAVVGMVSASLTTTDQQDLLVLGARKLTAYLMNPDYLKNAIAQERLNKAVQYMANGSYENANEKALEAAEIYSQLNDAESQKMALQINETTTRYIEAAALYRQAIGNYTSGEYKTAKDLAVSAEKIYLQLRDENKTNEALTLVNKAIDQIDADYYYQRALEYYRAGNYLEGSVYSRKTLDIYALLNDTQNTAKAQKLLNSNEEFPKANKNYDEAMRLYERGNYTEAKNKANDAKTSYDTVGDKGRAATVAALLTTIQDRIDRQQRSEKAAEYYGRAYNKYLTNNYHGCIEDATTSQNTYLNLTDAGGEAKARTLLQKCQTGVEAQQNWAKAMELYTSNQGGIAVDYATKARQLYRQIESTDGAIKCDELILEIEGQQQREASAQQMPTQDQLTILAAAAAVIIIAVLSYLVLTRLKKGGKPPEEQKEDYTQLLQPTPPQPEPTKEEPLQMQPETTPLTLPDEEPPLRIPEEKPTPPTQKETEETDRTISEKLDELLSQAGITTKKEGTQTPTTPQQEENPPQNEELKVAEKIKKELKEINEKLTKE